MKKKIAWIVSLFLGVIACLSLFTACQPEQKKPSLYEQLNTYAAKTYSTVVLDLSVTKKGSINDTLFGKYNVHKTSDGYSVDFEYSKFNMLFVGESGGMQESTTEYRGTVVYRNGVVAESSGDPLNYNVSTSLFVKFDGSNFSDEEKAADSLKAKVKNPSAFLMSEVSYTDMFFTVYYSANGCSRFELHYTDGSNNVDAYYNFTL